MPISKVSFGDNVLIDLTSDTVVESDVSSGKIFHKADGSIATGTLTSSGSEIDDSIVAFNSENQNVKSFISDARSQYPNDSTLTIVANYRDGVTAYDAPLAYTITGLSSGKIYFVDEMNGRTWFDTVIGSTYDVTNLIPNHVYRWINIDVSGTQATGRLKDTASLRLMSGVSRSSDSLRNFRDLGGWPCDGGTMKYGLLFRGARAHSISGDSMSETDKRKLWDFDRLWSELDMRSETDMDGIDKFSHINSGVKYDWHPMTGAYTSHFGLSSSHIVEAKSIIETCMNNVINGLPTYFHCQGGADRTATVASILEGVCGVSQVDIDIDYELTSMTPWDGQTRVRYGTDRSVEPDKYGVYWADWKSHIESLGGDNPYVTWCVRAGISNVLVNDFRRAMIDGTPQNIIVDGGDQEPVDKTNILTQAVDTDGSLYNNGLGYKENYRLSSNGTESSSSLEGNCVTGFIPCSVGDTFVLDGMLVANNNTFEGYRSSYYRIAVYDSSKTLIYCGSEYSAINRSINNPILSGDTFTQFTLNKLSSSTDITGTAFMRLSFKKTGTPKITKS